MMQDIERLVRMANQIADNFNFHDDAIERTLDHLRRFWAPSMRDRLVDFEAAGGAGLNEAARAAVRRLAAP
jgi:formate dehydrogenase subunit delta